MVMGCDVLSIYPACELGKKARFGFPPLGILCLASFMENRYFRDKVKW